MAEDRTDQQLMCEFAKSRSEQAFTALVRRHVDLVFATALRQVGQDQPAEEVTQNVFIALARKAIWLRGERALTAWLHKTTLLEARQWWRGEFRRQRREATAAELGTTMKEDESLLKSMAGALDEGLLQLRDPERQVLLLRYFEDRTHRDIGMALGLREDAVRKRIDKALERLTEFFRRRGYAVPAASIAATLGSAANAAPAGLAMSVTQAALTTTTASVTGLSVTLAKLMGLTKTQTALACIVLAAIPIAYQGQAEHTLRRQHADLASNLRALQQTLRASEQQREALGLQSRELQDALARLESKLAALPGAARQPNLWSEDSQYVQVPKAILAKIKIPAIGTDGLLTENIASALGLDEQQVNTANRALTDFSSRYHEIQSARSEFTDQHPSSIHVSPVANQKTLLCEAFPEDYQRLTTELKSTLEQALGKENTAYFWTNAANLEHEEFDWERGPMSKRITVFRTANQESGKTRYYLGEEYRSPNGDWGSAHVGPVEDESQIPFAQLREVFAQWRRDAQAPGQ